MSKRWLCALVAMASSGVLATHSVSEAPRDDEKCMFPDDCLRHTSAGINIGWGKCEGRSAWRERYVTSTRDERLRMRRARRTSMRQKILDAYGLTEAQRETCDRICAEFSANWRRGMGEQFDEVRALRRQQIDRLREYADATREFQRGAPGASEALKQFPGVRDDPKLRIPREREQQIKRAHPYDWSGLADRIEDALPKEQAKLGRERLGARFPFTISRRHGEKLAAESTGTEFDAREIDRWGAYVRQFTDRYELTEGQANAVASILREVRTQDAQLTLRMGDEAERDEARGHQEAARRRREAFQLDLDDLFENFKARLDGLLTTVQRRTSAKP